MFVTLVTGDRVAVRDGRAVSVVRGPGRERIRFVSETHDGRSSVIPEDALGLVASGQVDRRLFDVTGLIEAGYDDARRNTTPVLVTKPAGVLSARQISGTDLTAAQAPKTTEGWQALLQGGGKVWLDGIRRISLDQSTKQIGAPAAWQAGITGTGVKVAVLDTGVDEKHPDLAGKQIAEQNFTRSPGTTDTIGHGTHVASTIASGDATFRGVAPDVRILDGKVCDDRGCPDSSILAGMQWAADQGADVVNMSLGSSDTPGVDPIEELLDKLSAERGVLFVVSAGNSGAVGKETVGSPSTADAALSVGAVDRDETLAGFSSKGPRKGDGAVKPEVTAPGVGIVAAKAGTTERVEMSGTSMAAPHVTGAAALLKQQHPDWNGARIKAQLIATATPNATNTAYEQGAGRIDLAKAITPVVTADPATVLLGTHDWPHDDDKPVTEEITYRNPGTTEVTLDLSLDVKAPAGMFAVSPSKLTVPAGGTAKASVTGDSRVGSEDGGFSGAVVAAGPGWSTRAPIGLVRGVEMYNLTVKVTDHAGNPTGNHWTRITGTDNTSFFRLPQDPSAVVRVPKGKYFVDSQMFAAAPETAVDVLSYSEVDVSKDTTIELDARRTKPIEITAADPAAQQNHGDVNQFRKTPSGISSVSTYARAASDLRLAGFGPRLPGAYRVGIGAGLTSADGTQHAYAFEEQGILPTGFTRTIRKQDVAQVNTKIGPMPAGRRASFAVSPAFTDGTSFPWFFPASPGTVKYVVNNEKGITWGRTFYQVNGDEYPPEIYSYSPYKSYAAGKSYVERTNLAVFGPSLSSDFDLARRGDDIGVNVSLLADEAGGRGDAGKYESASTKLYRDGTLLGTTPYPSNGYFPKVGAGAATFRVESEIARSSSELSTKVSAAWTFKSKTTADTKFANVPLSVLRFEPVLSDSNSTPAGGLLAVPLCVQQSKNPDNGRINRIDVEVSFDDGKTWQQVPVAGRTALVRNPGAGFASLRAKVSDTKGNGSEVTVIRAYRIG
ncbi:S8 family serine peptidase [Lentzea sp. NPDC051838]|uniref:S8 family peptidase n=1 Tax=Lentzea sp. NPDC051838 TaxID=3154849 RepID=UPI00343B5D0C